MDAYSVGVSVYLNDKLTAGMGLVSNALLRAGQHTGQLQDKLSKIQENMVKLQALGSIGHAMFHGGVEALDGMLDKAKEYNNEIIKMQLNGMKATEIAQAQSLAMKNSLRNTMTTPTQNLEYMQDLRSAMGTEHAFKMTPVFTDELKVAMASADSKVGAKFGSQMVQGGKALEISGGMNKGEGYAAEQLDLMRRTLTMTHGRVDFSAYLNFFKQAKTAGMLLDDNYKYKISQYFMQEMGGQRWGTEVASVNQSINQGSMPVFAAQRMQALGLINYKEEIDKNNKHDAASTGMLGGAKWRTNPFEAVMMWQDQLLKKFPQIAAIKDPNDRYKAEAGVINSLGLNRGTTDAISKMILSQDMLRNKEFPMFNQTPGLKQALPTSEKSSIVQQATLQAQYNTALTQLGQQALPLATKGMVFLTGMLTKVNAFLSTDLGQKTAKLVVAATAATAFVGGLIAIGAPFAALITVCSAFGASVVGVGAGIVAAVGIGTLFFLKLMTSGKATALALQQAWTSIVTSSTAAMSGIYNKVVSGLNNLISPIASFFNRIAQFISNLVSGPVAALGQIANAGAQGLAGSINALLHGAPASPFSIQAANNPKTNPLAKPRNYVNPNARGKQTVINNSPVIHLGGIHQQPGEDAHALAKKVISMLTDQLHAGLSSSTIGGGTHESPWFHGSEIGG